MTGQTPSSPFTYLLTGGPPLTIVAADNVTAVSVQPVSGTVKVTGGGSFANTNAGSGRLNSQALSIPVGASLTFTTNGAQNPLDNFTIDATAGSCMIILSF